MKFRTKTDTVDGWLISLRNNVHMYCHQLTVTKGNTKIDVPCEDTPEGHIGVWVEDLNIDGQNKDDLISSLRPFFDGLGPAYKIYDFDGDTCG